MDLGPLKLSRSSLETEKLTPSNDSIINYTDGRITVTTTILVTEAMMSKIVTTACPYSWSPF